MRGGWNAQQRHEHLIEVHVFVVVNVWSVSDVRGIGWCSGEECDEGNVKGVSELRCVIPGGAGRKKAFLWAARRWLHGAFQNVDVQSVVRTYASVGYGGF